VPALADQLVDCGQAIPIGEFEGLVARHPRRVPYKEFERGSLRFRTSAFEAHMTTGATKARRGILSVP